MVGPVDVSGRLIIGPVADGEIDAIPVEAGGDGSLGPKSGLDLTDVRQIRPGVVPFDVADIVADRLVDGGAIGNVGIVGFQHQPAAAG